MKRRFYEGIDRNVFTRLTVASVAHIGATTSGRFELPFPHAEGLLSVNRIRFEVWKALLHDSCEKHGKQREFELLSDFVLKLLWDRGTDPTLEAIVDDAKNVP